MAPTTAGTRPGARASMTRGMSSSGLAPVLHGVDQDGITAGELQPGDYRPRWREPTPDRLDDRINDGQRDHVLVRIAVGVLDPGDEQEGAAQRERFFDPDGRDAKGAPG